MVAVNDLLNRESAATVTLDRPQDAERVLATVEGRGRKAQEEAGYAVLIGTRSGLSNARMAQILGKSTSYVTLCRRGGTYLCVGGQSGTDTWSILMSKSKANSSAPIREVLDRIEVEVLGAPDKYEAALGEIESVVTANFTPDGKPVPGSAAAAAADATAAKKKVEPSGEGAGDLPPLEVTLALLTLVEESLPALGREDWAAVESRMVAIREAQVKRMVDNAKAAAKPAKKAAAK